MGGIRPVRVLLPLLLLADVELLLSGLALAEGVAVTGKPSVFVSELQANGIGELTQPSRRQDGRIRCRQQP